MRRSSPNPPLPPFAKGGLGGFLAEAGTGGICLQMEAGGLPEQSKYTVLFGAVLMKSA